MPAAEADATVAAESEVYRAFYNVHVGRFVRQRDRGHRSLLNDRIEKPCVRRIVSGCVAGRRVLDVGCGTGLMTRWLAARGGSVTGLDCSEGML